MSEFYNDRLLATINKIVQKGTTSLPESGQNFDEFNKAVDQLLLKNIQEDERVGAAMALAINASSPLQKIEKPKATWDAKTKEIITNALKIASEDGLTPRQLFYTAYYSEILNPGSNYKANISDTNQIVIELIESGELAQLDPNLRTKLPQK